MRSQLEKNRQEQSLLAEELAREGTPGPVCPAAVIDAALEEIYGPDWKTRPRGDLLGRFGGPLRSAA